MERYDAVLSEFIDFVNQQVGVYMDALAGFAGHRVRIERQVHRVNRRVRSSIDDKGSPIIVWTSYEDPTKPDVIHNRIIRAEDYIAANSNAGSNEQQQAKAVLIFLYTYWEDEIRSRLAASQNVQDSDIRSDVMGDLRIIRNTILHTKSVISEDRYRALKVMQDLFTPDKPILFHYEGMQEIFVRIKQGCAALLFAHLKVTDAPMKPSKIRDFAIQRIGKKKPKAEGLPN